jgi:hypothetical protein
MWYGTPEYRECLAAMGEGCVVPWPVERDVRAGPGHDSLAGLRL